MFISGARLHKNSATKVYGTVILILWLLDDSMFKLKLILIRMFSIDKACDQYSIYRLILFSRVATDLKAWNAMKFKETFTLRNPASVVLKGISPKWLKPLKMKPLHPLKPRPNRQTLFAKHFKLCSSNMLARLATTTNIA